MPMFQFKRIERESTLHKVLRFVAYGVEFVWTVCQYLLIYVCGLCACAMLFLAIVVKDGYMVRISIGFGLLALALRFGPQLLAKIRRRIREKINAQNR